MYVNETIVDFGCVDSLFALEDWTCDGTEVT